MYIWSEKTKKRYETVEECLDAEKAYDEALEIEKERKSKLADERKARAKEIEEASKHLNELIDKFISDYGSYHLSLGSDTFPRLLKWFW